MSLLVAEKTRGQDSALKAFYATRNPARLKDAVGDLGVFGRFCNVESEEEVERLLFGVGSSLEKTQDLVLRYRDHLRSLDLAWGTINRRLAVIRGFNRIARLLGVVHWEVNVSAGDSQMRRDTRGANKKALLQVERMSSKSRQARRDRGIVLLADCLDLTRAEIVVLDLDQYHPDPSAPGVIVQGGIAAVTKKVKAALDAWIEVRGFKPGPLFTSLDGKAARIDPIDLVPLVRPDAVGS